MNVVQLPTTSSQLSKSDRRPAITVSPHVCNVAPLPHRADGLHREAALWAAAGHRGSDGRRRGQHRPRVCNPGSVGLRSAGLGQSESDSPPGGGLGVLLTSFALLSPLGSQSGLPYIEVLCKNRYVGRTFIQPNTRLRQLGVAKKFGALTDNFAGKRVVLIDDSIVRGNTISPIIRLLKEAGATEVCLTH